MTTEVYTYTQVQRSKKNYQSQNFWNSLKWKVIRFSYWEAIN